MAVEGTAQYSDQQNPSNAATGKGRLSWNDSTKEFVQTDDTGQSISLVGKKVNRRVETGTSTNAVLSDAGGQVSMNNAGGNTFNLVLNSSVDFEVDHVINILQLGIGTTTIQAPAGVTINGVDANAIPITGQYRTISVQQISIDNWIAYGAL